METSEIHESSENQPKNVPEQQDITAVSSATQNINDMSLNPDRCCKQCAIKFEDDTSSISHTKTEGHVIMVLVTGVACFEQDPYEPCGFPPLYYCVLCNVFSLDYNLYKTHLLGIIHKEMAQFARNISFWKEKIIVGQKCKNKEPSTAQDFEDLKNFPPHYCQLCDKQCNSSKTLENHTQGQMHKKLERVVIDCEICNISFVNFTYYDRHLKTDLHTRMKDFISKMLISANEITATPEKRNRVSQYAEANPGSLYFCKLCNAEFHDIVWFRRHRKTPTHRRVHDLINKISLKPEKADELNEDTANGSVPRIDYCNLCKIWCLSSIQTYDDHAKTGSHLMNRSTEVVRNWDCSPDNHPPGFDPWK